MPEDQKNNRTVPTGEQNSEANRQKNLNQVQRSSNLNNQTNQAKNLGKAMNPVGALSVFSQIKVDDFLFIIPISAAILKDASDIIIIGSLPGLGTVISICCSITIGLFTITLGAGGAKKNAKGVISGSTKIILMLTGGTLVEMVPGVDFLPVETLTALAVYYMVLVERKQGA